MMFGYANNETDTYMPLALSLAHDIMIVLAEIRREGKVMTYLRPDSKSQVTIAYDDNDRAVGIRDAIVVSTQHDEFISAEEAGSQEKADQMMMDKIREDVIGILIPRVVEGTRQHARSESPLCQGRHQILRQPNGQVRYRRSPR